jgi:serine/threonine-protein kinase
MIKKEQHTIEEKISESTTTAVFRAFDEQLHRRVLLKVLHKHLANDREIRERFVREARACAALKSEHIVQVYDLTEIDGAPAIVMEFVEGKSLKDVIAGEKDAAFDRTKKTAVHVLRGLSVAHSKGIIHRDIKPGNILVGNDGTIKVTDFGLASFAASPTVTMEGMVLGTPAYMAPEQLRGEEIDARTDLFALGATLVETLSGERIFEGSSYSECMKKVLAFTESNLDRYSERSSPEFAQFLKQLMHPKREERFSSAAEALAALGEDSGANAEQTGGTTPKKNMRAVYSIAGMLAVISIIVIGRMIFPSPVNDVNQAMKSSVPTVGPAQDSAGLNAESDPVPPRETDNLLRSEERRTIAGNSVSASVQDSGKLIFTGIPWAKVYVNNRLIGETPIAKPLVLAAGEHSVMFVNPSFDPIMTTVTVFPNKEQTVAGNFLEHAGYVMCTVTPWADVYVDEQYKDTTPLTKPIMVSAGKRTLRFKNSAFGDIVKEITVSPKDTAFISISFIQ